MTLLKRISYYLKLKANGCHYVRYWNDGEPPYFTYLDKDWHCQRTYLK